MIAAPPRSLIEPLVERAGYGGNFNASPITAGSNNRVFRLAGDGWSAVVKIFFRDREDPRDRFAAETTFADFLWRNGVFTGPQVLARDAANGLALFATIEGREGGNVDRDGVLQAAAFFRSINALRQCIDADKIASASEACFSIAQHADLIERRVKALGAAPEPVAEFQRRELAAVWRDARRDLVACSDAARSKMLEPDSRCLSPSDFGFHNAIRQPDGGFRFFDFEYAGWDDPAKMLCDFFCQEKRPVPLDLFGEFAAAALRDFSDPEGIVSRAELLMPAYRVKWSCIMLNQFTETGIARRRFARGQEDRAAACAIAKVRSYLNGDGAAP